MNFESLGIPIPKNITKYTLEEKTNIYEYLSSMNTMQKQAYEIAYDHLGSSFNIFKSNGYLDWKQNKMKPY
jgi:competence protein ComGC